MSDIANLNEAIQRFSDIAQEPSMGNFLMAHMT